MYQSSNICLRLCILTRTCQSGVHWRQLWGQSVHQAAAAAETASWTTTERSSRAGDEAWSGRRRQRPEDGTGSGDEQVHRGDRVPAGPRRADGRAVLRGWHCSVFTSQTLSVMCGHRRQLLLRACTAVTHLLVCLLSVCVVEMSSVSHTASVCNRGW